MLAAVPSDAVIVDEAISNAGWIPLLGDFQRPDDFVALARGGSLGYGLGSAIGAHIGSGRPVLVVVGDGSLTYAPQGLWTIAHERLPIVTCVLNNGGYEILKQFARTHFDDGAEGRDGGDSDPLQASMLDIGAPSLDFAALARAWGVEAVRVGSASECRDAVAHAFATGRPWLIDVPVASSKG